MKRFKNGSLLKRFIYVIFMVGTIIAQKRKYYQNIYSNSPALEGYQVF